MAGPAPLAKTTGQKADKRMEVTEVRAGISTTDNKSQKDSAPRDEKAFKY